MALKASINRSTASVGAKKTSFIRSTSAAPPKSFRFSNPRRAAKASFTPPRAESQFVCAATNAIPAEAKSRMVRPTWSEATTLEMGEKSSGWCANSNPAPCSLAKATAARERSSETAARPTSASGSPI